MLRPAIRGTVAHEPPSMTLCFPSKKSAAIALVLVKVICLDGRRVLTAISWIYLHSLEALVRHKCRAGPFPDTTEFPLSCEVITMREDGGRVPVFEARVGSVHVAEDG